MFSRAVTVDTQDTEKYGRTISIIHVGDRTINVELGREGLRLVIPDVRDEGRAPVGGRGPQAQAGAVTGRRAAIFVGASEAGEGASIQAQVDRDRG